MSTGLRELVGGFRVSQAIHVAAALGIADLLRHGVRSADELAQASGSDPSALRMIVHDWEDEEAIAIVRNCRAAIQPGAVLLVIERLLAPPNEGPEGKLSDLDMLVMPGGRERTAEEFEELFEATGFRLGEIVPSGVLNVLEGLPA